MAAKIYHEILRVNEDEMRKLMAEEARTVGPPAYYCINRNKTLTVWPTLDPECVALVSRPMDSQ